MKATIDVPDTLYRQVKARSAIQGRSIRDVTVDLYERWLTETAGSVAEGQGADRTAAAAVWLRRWEALGERIGESPTSGRTTREMLTGDRRQ